MRKMLWVRFAVRGLASAMLEAGWLAHDYLVESPRARLCPDRSAERLAELLRASELCQLAAQELRAELQRLSLPTGGNAAGGPAPDGE